MTKLMQSEQFTITIGSAIATPGTTTDFKTALDAVGSNEKQFAPVTKDIDFKQPEVTTDEVKFIGATGGIQNSAIDPQAPTKGEFTGTIVGNPEEGNDFDFEAFMLTVESVKATGYTDRYNYASTAPAAGVAIVIQRTGPSGGNITNWLLNNAVVETLGGVKLDADGHALQEIKVTAAASDCWKESDIDGSS